MSVCVLYMIVGTYHISLSLSLTHTHTHTHTLSVRAGITDIRTDPDHPIEGMNARCLSASGIQIFCDNVAFPVATVEFLKDGAQVIPDGRYVCVCMCV